MPSGDMKPVKVPVSKNMLESHLRGKICRKARTMVTLIVVDAEVQLLYDVINSIAFCVALPSAIGFDSLCWIHLK